jgi:hypothetical protein
MLYCDMTVDSNVLWTGAQCNNLTQINGAPYLGFLGALYFNDIAGTDDPDYTGLTTQFQLLWLPPDTTDTSQALVIPLQAIPNQQVSVALGGQNCTISIYTRTATLTES